MRLLLLPLLLVGSARPAAAKRVCAAQEKKAKEIKAKETKSRGGVAVVPFAWHGASVTVNVTNGTAVNTKDDETVDTIHFKTEDTTNDAAGMEQRVTTPRDGDVAHCIPRLIRELLLTFLQMVLSQRQNHSTYGKSPARTADRASCFWTACCILAVHRIACQLAAPVAW